MTRKKFDRIYREAGVADGAVRKIAWEARHQLPDLEEETVRISALAYKLLEPYIEELGRFICDYADNRLLKADTEEFFRFLVHKNN